MCIHEKLAIIECGVIDNGNCVSPAYNVYCDNCDTEIACGLCFVDARVLCERWLEYNTLKAKAELFDELVAGIQEIKDLATENRWNTGVLASNPPQNPIAYHVEHRAETLLSKAKEL